MQKDDRQMPPPESGRLYTVEEVAIALRVSPATVRHWIEAGVIDAIELPKRGTRRMFRIRSETLNKLLGITGS
jgi:excisionase family DNA binding protein